MRVACVLPYPTDCSPGQRFRVEQWLSLLPPGAVDVRHLPLLTPAAYRRLYEPGGTAAKAAHLARGAARRLADVVTASKADVVYLYREAFPVGPPVLEALLERRVPVVYDFDDAIWLGDTSEANRWARRLKRPAKVGDIVQGATTTTVGNEYLASYARQYSTSVRVLPTTLDVERYRPRPRPPRTDGLVRVGWSGSPTTSAHLRPIEGALRRVLRELPVELLVYGDRHYRLDGAPRVEARPWSAATEQDEVSAFDVGLMPLPDDEWTRGKGGFKALLYMALGVPAVVSPVGVNTEIVTDGVSGLLAGGEDHWVEAIGRLVEDERLRRRLGAAGRETVIERYSGQRWAPQFLEVLEEAASGGRRR